MYFIVILNLCSTKLIFFNFGCFFFVLCCSAESYLCQMRSFSGKSEPRKFPVDTPKFSLFFFFNFFFLWGVILDFMQNCSETMSFLNTGQENTRTSKMKSRMSVLCLNFLAFRLVSPGIIKPDFPAFHFLLLL